jgi:NADPH:quinone reductase-like Zn-dependent oxidoreductase
MKAVVLTGHGGYEQLEYRSDVPVPRPGVGEVLIQVRAAALNNTDINMRVGWYSKSMSQDTATASASIGSPAGPGDDGGWAGDAPAFPLIQGADVCGHEIRPIVARTYQLSAIVAAQREFLSKKHTGKIVLLL